MKKQQLHVLIVSAFFFCLILKCRNEPKIVTVGVVLPLTGDFSSFGKMGRNGALMAVEEINRSGGILGRQLELRIKDNMTDPNLSISLARDLIINEDVIAILGPVSSTALYNLKKVAEDYETPLLYGIDYEGGMFSRYLFCYSPVPNQMINPLIPYLKETGGDRFFVFGYDYIWPHKITESIEIEIEKHGCQLLGTEFTPFGVRDYSDIIDEIIKLKVNSLVLILPGPDGLRFLEQINKRGYRKNMKIAMIAADESYTKLASPETLEGVITSVHFIESLENEEARKFVKKNKRFFGESVEITFSTESHYGLIMLLKKAIEKSGSFNKEKIIEAMENLSLVVGNGEVTMNENHHMSLNMLIAEYKNGDLMAVKDFGLIEPYYFKSKIIETEE